MEWPCVEEIIDVPVVVRKPPRYVLVRIGCCKYRTERSVLMRNMTYFRAYPCAHVVKVPAFLCSARAFSLLYKWAAAAKGCKPVICYTDAVELLYASKNMGFAEIQNSCMAVIRCKRHTEDHILRMANDASKYGFQTIRNSLFDRMSKIFLTFVASKEFKKLDVKAVWKLLQSDNVAVNSEMEIFLVMVYWLNMNWKERNRDLLELLKCVRFPNLPPYFLIALGTYNDTAPEMLRVTEHIEVKREVLKAVRGYPMESEMRPRKWAYDPKCPYHCRYCPRRMAITYVMFMDYLRRLSKLDRCNWRLVKYIQN